MKPSLLDWTSLNSYFEEASQDEVAESLSTIHRNLKKRDRPAEKTVTVVPKKQAPETPRIEEIEQHNVRDDQLALFALNMSKGFSNYVINKPPQIDVLAYCARYKNEMPWYISMQHYIASSAEHYDYPDVPVLSRAMIQDFLRVPQNPGERPCINLDRDPFEGENRIRCAAHRLTSKPENGGKGFRLRELILGDTLTRVNEAVAKKQDYSQILDPVPDMCFLCHLWLCLKDSTYQRDKKTQASDKVVIINRFMVMIDIPGEYDRNKMLMSDKVNTGLWGPVPLFNKCNYIVHQREGRIEESANLLFRLTRVSSPLIDVSPAKTSIQSNRTNATLSSGNLHH
jgi:hypothetical protein